MSTEVKSMRINTKDIVVNPLAQRDVERRRAQFNKIMRYFNDDLVNPIKVAFIDGKYYCFDGQMTMKVLKARNGGQDLCVYCKCYYGLTDVDMANLFVNQNGIVSKVTVADKLRVLNNFGDSESVQVVRLTESEGLEISWNGQKGKNAIMAVATLIECFRLLDGMNNPDDFKQVIRVIKGAWDGNPNGSCSEILKGITLFVKTYKGQFDESRLIRKLHEKLPSDIVRDARQDRSGGSRKYGVQILQIYNGSLRNPLPNKL